MSKKYRHTVPVFVPL